MHIILHSCRGRVALDIFTIQLYVNQFNYYIGVETGGGGRGHTLVPPHVVTDVPHGTNINVIDGVNGTRVRQSVRLTTYILLFVHARNPITCILKMQQDHLTSICLI